MAVGPMITATSIRLRERAFDCRLAEGGYTGDGELFDQAFKMIEQQAAEIEHHQAAKRRALAIADERAIEANGVRAENERLRAARIAEREMIANTAREWSEHYPQSSDGRNTFVLFAEWVERGDLEQTGNGK